MILFKRRDTRFWVLAMAGFAAFMPLTFALGSPAYTPAIQIPLSALVFAAVAGGILRWRRALPPDIDLAYVDPADAARLVAASPPPDATLVFIAFERDWLRRYRLDVTIDGQHAGQLPSGTCMLLTLQPGLRTLQVFLDRPVTAMSELINSIPGGYAGFTVRNRGGRAIELDIRRGLTPALGKHMRLVRPAVPKPAAWGWVN